MDNKEALEILRAIEAYLNLRRLADLGVDGGFAGYVAGEGLQLNDFYYSEREKIASNFRDALAAIDGQATQQKEG